MSLKEYFEFYAPTKVMFGQGLAEDVGAEAEVLGGTSAMIITDEAVLAAGLVEKAEKSISESFLELVTVYSSVPVNSEVDVCIEIAEIGKANGVDMLVSVGGGSVIDTAKGANILLGVGGSLLDDWQGTHLVPEPLKKHIAIPTTAGTGAEVTLAAVIKHSSMGQKITFNSRYLLPDVAVLDPELTVSMPSALTAATGIDALTHAVESFSSLEHSPPSDALSYYCVESIFESLPSAVEDGNDLEARGNMLVAANLAGTALSSTLSIGACHAMAHSVGGLSPVSHGVANAIILPVVMEYNLDYCSDRYAMLARAARIDTVGMSEVEAAQAFIDAVGTFIAGFGLPRTLSEAGVDSSLTERMTEEALGDAQMFGNPREADFDEILGLYRGLLP